MLTYVFGVIFSTAVFAQSVVVQSNHEQNKAYHLYVKAHQQSLSWSNYLQHELNDFPEERNWISLLYTVLEESNSVGAYLEAREYLLNSQHWNETKRSILLSFYLKVANHPQFKKIRSDFCFLQIAMSETGVLTNRNCRAYLRPVEGNLKKSPDAPSRYGYFAFGLRLQKYGPTKGEFNFTKVSDSELPVNLWGPLEELKAQSLVPIVSGRCDHFKEARDAKLPPDTHVFFDLNCVRELRPQYSQDSRLGKFWKKNSSWMVPSALVIVVGAVLLKDKKMTFSF